MPKKRNFNLDIIRITACFMVVLMHSPLPNVNAPNYFLTAASFMTAPSIGLFFMTSGALLLPVKTDYFYFLKHRFSKIVIPTVFWSIIYIVLRLYFTESELGLWKHICSIPFSAQGEGVLWFMYTLAGLYLLAPILSAWLEKASRQEIEIVLSLWGITLCYPILSYWVILQESNVGILYYFTGYAGYFLLGYYLTHYPKAIKLRYCITITILGGCTLLYLKYHGIKYDFYSLFWYLSIFIVAFAITIWKIINLIKISFDNAWSNLIILLSNISFGVYLIHILIMRRWLWHIDCIYNIENYILQSIIIACATFIISSFICIIVAQLPLAKYIIGYQHHKS